MVDGIEIRCMSNPATEGHVIKSGSELERVAVELYDGLASYIAVATEMGLTMLCWTRGATVSICRWRPVWNCMATPVFMAMAPAPWWPNTYI